LYPRSKPKEQAKAITVLRANTVNRKAALSLFLLMRGIIRCEDKLFEPGEYLL
jgi:hypothetical protein